VDAVRFLAGRRHFSTVRLVAFGWIYLTGQVLGVASLASVWVASWCAGSRRSRFLLDATYTIQRVWAVSLFAAVRRLFGLQVEVVGDELLSRGPMIVFIRHASIIDTLLPTVLVTARHRIRLRFVLKRELLIDPCLDIAGHRLPNHFVDRSGAESAAELAAVAELAQGLSPGDGVLIYPEGTRFSQEKRQRALERIALSDPDLHKRAQELRHVLPPRPGGSLALLEHAPTADAVFFAHHGLDGFGSIADIFAGALSGRTVRVRIWRAPAHDIPSERSARTRWLYENWKCVDDWVGAQRQPQGAADGVVARSPAG
jgi:1-acyl-sn-glycerol-3-phosphate acyltransferase